MTTELRPELFLVAGRFPGQDDGDALHRAQEAVDAAERAVLDNAWLAEHHFMSSRDLPVSPALPLDRLDGPEVSAGGERSTFREVEVIPEPARSLLPPVRTCTS